MGFLAYISFAAALAGLAASVTWAMARWAVLVDVPNARSSHRRPTPRGGGVGIVLAFACGMLGLSAGTGRGLLEETAIVGLIGAAAIAALAGLADDVRPLSSAMKFGAQIAAALVAMASGLVVDTLSLPALGPVTLGPLAYPVTALWLVGMTNAFNFMDGLDGLAASTATLVAAFLGAVAILLGDAPVAVFALILAAASTGFLVFNFPPAKIFMGDVGSQFLGFMFAGLGVFLAKSDLTGTLIFVVPILLFNFLFDTIFTAAYRLLRGENPTAAHRTHLYQLLNQAGASHRTVTAVHAVMVVMQGFAALWLVGASPEPRWLIFLFFGLLQTGYACCVLRLYFRVRESISK